MKSLELCPSQWDQCHRKNGWKRKRRYRTRRRSEPSGSRAVPWNTAAGYSKAEAPRTCNNDDHRAITDREPRSVVSFDVRAAGIRSNGNASRSSGRRGRDAPAGNSKHSPPTLGTGSAFDYRQRRTLAGGIGTRVWEIRSDVPPRSTFPRPHFIRKRTNLLSSHVASHPAKKATVGNQASIGTPRRWWCLLFPINVSPTTPQSSILKALTTTRYVEPGGVHRYHFSRVQDKTGRDAR